LDLGARFTKPINWVSGTAVFRRLQEPLIGISRFRTLPKLSQQSFISRFKPAFNDGSRPKVILFLDTYTNAIGPSIGDSACKVLDAAGYQVQLVEQQGCCGRPSISKGLLDHARQLASANLDALTPFVLQGIPIIGLEPSCLLTLRDEYLELFPEDARAAELSRHAWMLEEFLVRPDGEGVRPIDRLEFRTRGEQKVHLHNHCFSKALIGSGPLLEMLGRAGYQVEEIPSGCCGMAGSFGYEAEHYELSMKIAQQRLLPLAKAASESGSMIAAGGISCRTQLMDGGGIGSYHPAHLLAAALADGNNLED
jgi:Fe-S oxidoreductase